MWCLRYKIQREIETAESFQDFIRDIAITAGDHRDLLGHLSRLKSIYYSDNFAEYQEDISEYLKVLHNY